MDTMAEIEAALLALLSDAPQIISDASTGTGGLQKIVKLGGDALAVATQIQQVIAAHPAVTTPGTPAA